jgi:hypothetical protein
MHHIGRGEQAAGLPQAGLGSVHRVVFVKDMQSLTATRQYTVAGCRDAMAPYCSTPQQVTQIQRRRRTPI